MSRLLQQLRMVCQASISMEERKMPYHFPPDVEKLVADRMASGNYETEDDVLRDALQALAEEESDLEALREAIAALKNGDDGAPLDEAIATIRTGGPAVIESVIP